MTNHLKDLADQIEAVAVELNGAKQWKDPDDPTESEVLREAIQVLYRVPCQHNAVEAETQDGAPGAPTIYVCQWCGKELVQAWVVKS